MVHFKEIGGNFPMKSPIADLEEECIFQNESPYFFSSGRSAILAVIQLTKAEGKKIAMPYFTCHSVIEPFVNRGCEIIYYPIELDLKVNEKSMARFCHSEQPYLIFYHDYFGLNEAEKWQNVYEEFQDSVIFVNDQTHSFFNANASALSHYSLMSIRKWGGISEGGILQVNQGSDADVVYASRPETDCRLKSYIQASQLKEAYLNGDTRINKESFRELFYHSESFFDSENEIYPIHKTAMLAWGHLLSSDFAEKRKSNFQVLDNGWKEEWRSWGDHVIEFSSDITPLYFPVILKIERQKLQDFLASNKVYAPIIWPKSTLIHADGDDTLYHQLLCIPIDQRYGEEEMKNVLKLLADFHLMISDERN
jgi:hypothetical protein